MSLIAELGPILCLAALLGLAMARLGQPPLLGYLVAGVVAGRGLFGLIWHTETITALGDIGLTLLLFDLGLELSWRKMAPIAGRSLALALAVVAVPFLFLFNGLLLIGFGLGLAAVIALILSLNSTAIGVQALEVRGALASRPGQLLIGTNVLVDIVAILALAALGAGHGHADLPVGRVLLHTLGFAAACATLGAAVVPRALDWIHGHAASRLLMPITLIAFGLMVAEAGRRIGVPMSVGAFLAGALAAEARSRDALEQCLHPIKELLLGLFFVSIGFQIDPARLPGLLPYAIGLSVLIIIVRFAAVTATAYASGEEPGDSLTLGAALVPMGELSFLLIAGAGLGEPLSRTLIAVAALSMLLTTPAVELLISRAPAIDRTLSHRAPGALRHLLYILRGALAPAISPFSPSDNRVRVAFRELMLPAVVVVGLAVGLRGAAAAFDRLTPLDLRLAGPVVSIAVLLPGFYILWRRWQRLLTAIVGEYRTGPRSESIRLIQRATRAALTTLVLGLLSLAMLPSLHDIVRGRRVIVVVIVSIVGLALALLFRGALLRLHHLLAGGMWGRGAPDGAPPVKSPDERSGADAPKR